MEGFKLFTEVIHNIVVTLAAVVGGIWVLNRLKRERTDEAALEMTLAAKSSPVGNQHLVFFTVQLANKGKTKIEATTKKTATYAFDDGVEKLRHSCSLQIRLIDETRIGVPQSLDWFEGGPWQEMKLFRGEAEINVLIEYENPKAGDKMEFWMEPGETYRLGLPVVLPVGVYLAKLTFVGAEQPVGLLDTFLRSSGLIRTNDRCEQENFWSQVYSFTVPASAEESSQKAAKKTE
jgi:hypothetical protein